MFSIVRFVLIVGVIFYYSPVRERGELPTLDWLMKGAGSGATPAAPAPAPSDHLETLWKALPESAKRAVIDKILSAPGPGTVTTAGATDTLHPEERHPAYVNKPRI